MEHIIEEQSKSINKLVKANNQMSEYIETLRDENTRLCEQLDEVTAEKDEAVALIASLVDLCNVPRADQSKVFRRLVFGAGDYMGSGYAFIDAFYHIWDEFEENAAEPLYRSIRTALDGLRKETGNEKVQG